MRFRMVMRRGRGVERGKQVGGEGDCETLSAI